MKRLALITLLFCLSISRIFAQQEGHVDKEKMAALMKQLEALKGISKGAISRNPDSAMAIYRKAMKPTDSLKTGIVHDALKSAPQGALAERYLNTKTFSDTTFTTVQFMGSEDRKAEGTGDVLHIAANCTAERAPLVQHGSTFSIMLMSNEQFDNEAAIVSKNKNPAHAVKYVVQRTKMESYASLNSVVHYMGFKTDRQSHVGKYEPITETTNTGNRGKTKQFIFSFDTLTNIGQVSYLEVLPATTITVGGDSAGTKLHEVAAGITAVTDPNTYKFNEWEKDASMKKLDTLTNDKLFQAKVHDDGEAKAILIVEKTKTGFKLTCKSTITKDGTTTNIHIIAYIGKPNTEYEAIIKPVEEGDFRYEKWVPKGAKVDGSDNEKDDGSDDEKEGRSLQFYVEVHSKKDPTKLYNGNFKVEWLLRDVTKYPGICNNYPAYTDNPDVRPDLRFDPKLMKDDDFDAFLTDGETATTKDDKGKVTFVKVISRDYAAWGKLIANVTLKGEPFPLIAHPYYSNDIGFITIPYDKDENKLADQWEKDNNVYESGYPLTWDKDSKPELQKDNGDGYTLFEEYRGFAVHKPKETADKQDVHERTDPDKKDVFVYDRDKLFQDYYEPYNPSNLNWHYVADEKKQFINKLPDWRDPMHRIINFNKVDDYFYTYQFCVALFQEQGFSPPDGLAVGITFSRAEYENSIIGTAVDEKIEQLMKRTDLDDQQKKKARNKLINDFNEQFNKNKEIYKPKDGESPLQVFIKASIYPDKIKST